MSVIFRKRERKKGEGGESNTVKKVANSLLSKATYFVSKEGLITKKSGRKTSH